MLLGFVKRTLIKFLSDAHKSFRLSPRGRDQLLPRYASISSSVQFSSFYSYFDILLNLQSMCLSDKTIKKKDGKDGFVGGVCSA